MTSSGRVTLAHHAHVFPQSLNPDGTIDALLRHLDECDIARAVCFAPLPYQSEGLDANGWLANELKSQDRFFAFGTVDFTRDDCRDQVKRIVDLGFKGIKIHPPGQKLNILCKAALDTYAAAQDAGLFLTFHTGVHHHRLRDTLVIDWDEIAWNFPNLRFSMEHVGGWSFFHEAVAVMQNNTPPPWEKGRCNVFAGLTSVFSPEKLPFWYMTRERHLEVKKQAGVNQMIFGLDFPYNDVAATKRGIEMIRSLDLSEEETAKILGGNIARELGV